MSKSQLLGKIGEDLAAQFLESQGYQVLERNVRTPYGEIDLIVQKKQLIVIVEVKTRSSRFFGNPEEAVDYKKQEKIRKSLLWWLQTRGQKTTEVRLDVIGILKDSAGKLEIEHWQGAFE